MSRLSSNGSPKAVIKTQGRKDQDESFVLAIVHDQSVVNTVNTPV
jgi:hypothetical protein